MNRTVAIRHAQSRWLPHCCRAQCLPGSNRRNLAGWPQPMNINPLLCRLDHEREVAVEPGVCREMAEDAPATSNARTRTTTRPGSEEQTTSPSM